jgi:chromosome segregation ATPase
VKGIFRQRARLEPRDEEPGTAQNREHGVKYGAEGEEEPRSIAGGLGFEPPRRGVTLPGRSELVEAERAPTRKSRDADESSAQTLERARGDAEWDAGAELRRLNDQLKRREAEHAQAVTEAEGRIQDTEQRAAAEGEHRLVEALEEQREELEADMRRRVAAARDEAKQEGEATFRAREEEFALELDDIEAELATTGEQLALAEDRIASLEQRADEFEEGWSRTGPKGS